MDADPTSPLPPMKLTRNGKPTRKYVGGPVVLNARMLRMISLMTEGHPHDPSRTRYGLYDAAAAVGYQRRAARELAMAPVFVEAYRRAAAGKSNANEVPTLEQVQQEIARQRRSRIRAPAAGYVMKLAPKENALPDPQLTS